MAVRYLMLAVSFAALSACGKQSAHASAPTVSEPAASEAAAAAKAGAAWEKLAGVWSPDGVCADEARTLRVGARAFQFREVRCSIDHLEMIEDGVRAIAQCSVSGDDDHIVDNFKFVSRGADELAMINEANDGVKNLFARCREVE